MVSRYLSSYGNIGESVSIVLRDDGRKPVPNSIRTVRV